jgi:hypothetical protein
MGESLTEDLERILHGLAKGFAEEGKAREVALLAHSRATIEQKDYGNWNGGTYEYTIYLVTPAHLYVQIDENRDQIEKMLKQRANDLARMYANEHIQAFVILPELPDDDRWREKAKAWVSGQGISNQGRARSDNVAPLMADGLLFRSDEEINLYRAFKALGISFAPLPVFVRGGETYRRIEPDFVILKDGIVVIVEVDGDTVHRETPREAHDRVTMLLHEGAHVERVNAKECETPERAKACAAKILAVIEKLKINRT